MNKRLSKLNWKYSGTSFLQAGIHVLPTGLLQRQTDWSSMMFRGEAAILITKYCGSFA